MSTGIFRGGFLLSRVHLTNLCLCRRYESTAAKKGIILGYYSESDKDEKPKIDGTPHFNDYNSKHNNSLLNNINIYKKSQCGSSKLIIGVDENYSAMALTSAGKQNAKKENQLECFDQSNERIRTAVSAGVAKLNELDIEEIHVDCFNNAKSAAEGAGLASWKYKTAEKDKLVKNLYPVKESDMNEWEEGMINANGQNFARFLMESPANIMTPTYFANVVKEKLENCGSKGAINVEVFDEQWIKQENMNAFLSVAKGSDEPPKFMKISYKNTASNENPIVLVGKGVTFDSGGISIKPSQNMDEMRADMGGAAVVAGSLLAAAQHNVKDCIIGLIPLCENMVNGKATRPGDVITARNKKSIQINNTDAEGRLLLADAISYANDLNPRAILDLATLTGAIVVALGASASAVYTNDEQIWDGLNKAGMESGDRVWRMPLFDLFKSQVSSPPLADLCNIGNAGRAAGSCTAAAFLREFVAKDIPWAHIDIAGVMSNKNEVPYLGKGMSGRPTRTIVEFLRQSR